MALFSKKKAVRSPKIGSPRQPTLTSYYRSKGSPEDPSPFSKKKPGSGGRKVLLGFLDIVLVAVILIGLGYSLMVRANPKIIASDLSYHSIDDYQQVATGQLRLLKNRNKVTLDEQAIALKLQKQFPELSRVQVELPFFSEQPTIRLTIARPSLFLKSQADEYVVSAAGVAVGRADQLPNIKGLTHVSDDSGFKVKPGVQVLSSNSINFINSLIGQCQYAKVPIASLTLPPLAEELDLRTKDQPYFVKFYLGGDVLSETGQFLAARKHFSDIHQQPSQYLDVRVAGKIFYK
jgi:hypothetical protein